MLVVNALSVCKLVSALRFEFTWELQVIINVLLFSEVIVVVGREHREGLTVASLKHLGLRVGSG